MNMQGSMMNGRGGTWHASYAQSERKKIIEILTNCLKEVQSGGVNEQQAHNSALEFEKFAFVKALSRDEYLNVVRSKIEQFRSIVREKKIRASAGAELSQQQLQQVAAMVKTAPIPPALLQKLPNLPPNVNTWAQIYDLAAKKMLPANVMAAAREVQQAHFQLAVHQLKMRMGQNMGQNMGQAVPRAAKPEAPQQPAAAKPTLSAQEQQKYVNEALAVLARMQQEGLVPANFDKAQKQNFVQRYIYQKLSAKKPFKAPMAMGQQGHGQGQTGQNLTQNHTQNHSQTTQNHSQNLGQNTHASLQNPPGQGQGNGMSHMMPMNGMGQMMNQNMNMNLMHQGMNQNMGGAPGQYSPKRRPKGMPTLTDEMKMKLRGLIEEVAAQSSSTQLRDMTMLLAEKDKQEIKETMTLMKQQFASIDSLISYFYAYTQNADNTKRLIHIKYMVKSFAEGLQRGVYLAVPDTVNKMRQQCQRYYDYVKMRLAQLRQESMGQAMPQVPMAGMNQMGQMGMNQMAQVPLGQMQPQLSPQMRQYLNYNLQSPMMGQAQTQPQPQMPPQSQGQGMVPMGLVPVPLPMSQGQVGLSPAAPGVLPMMSQPVQPVQPVQQQVQQQFARTAANPQWKLMGSSPMMRNAAPPKPKPPRRTSVGGANRRKLAKTTPTAPTPGIKTPSSILTPQLTQPVSAKGTPVAVLPHKEPLVDVVDEQRLLLAHTDAQLFFFSALGSMLELDDRDEKKPARLPLLPQGGWTCSVRPAAISLAFRQVEHIRDLTADNVLAECARVGAKRDVWFNEKDVDFAEPRPELGVDEWRSWLGVQSV